eukprot:TRINITY_DN47565_c0_g1_i1.p1 TRINITY_DN47565_c0_g1~~TRINITY_DN47565_c0_g1_i1.p1  ORF type:complete len:985 (+),score=290.16 TRINITY_DN47565_c0_g1_i1:57-3011(+)
MRAAAAVLAASAATAAADLFSSLHDVEFRNAGVTTSNDEFHWEVLKPVGEGQVAIYLEADNVSCTQCVWSDQGKYYTPHNYLFKTTKGSGDSHYAGVSPASGMRSAVPLGGIGAGSVELRGDGSLHEWTIHNAGPQGAAKIQQYLDGFFAMSVNGESRVLLTHPAQATTGSVLAAEGVGAMQYRGSYPFSRLDVVADTPAAANRRSMLRAGGAAVSASLFGFSPQVVGDLAKSSRPAVAFSLAVNNTGAAAASVGLMFNLPLLVEADQARPGTAIGKANQTADAPACAAQCGRTSGCRSWTWDAASKMCTAQSDAPLNRYQRGVWSGLAGKWEVDASSQCLTLSRPGRGPMHGNVSVCVSTDGAGAGWSAAAADSATDLYKQFAGGALKGGVEGAFGAAAVSSSVAAGSSATLTVTVGWDFPNRDHYNYAARTESSFAPFGNKYADHYAGSVDSAWGSAPAGGKREAALLGEVASASVLRSALFTTAASSDTASIPDWLQDILLNSVSHMRTAMWWRTCPHCHYPVDSRVNASTWGVWRQYEATDCPDLDSIHNDGERHIPYIMTFPDTTRDKLAAWAGNQGSDGMLAEQILNKNPDQPQGRIMSDSTSMFIIYVLELLRWTGDTATAKTFYPTVKRGAQWQMAKSKDLGVPKGLQTTYDILRFPEKYQISAYATVFHLAAMRAAEELAIVVGDSAFAAECRTAFTRAQAAFDKLQWNAEKGLYNAGSNGCTADGCTSHEGVFSDAFYAQVLAYTVGLGELLADPAKLDSHLNATWKANCIHNDPKTGAIVPGCPNGMVTMTGRKLSADPLVGTLTDLQVWEMCTHDHVSLLVHRGASVKEALAMSEGSGTSYAKRINDQWNTAGITSNDGYPSITSHYGYHMVVWHTLFAVTGQTADMTYRSNSTLTFNPRLTCSPAGTGYSVPVLLPGVVGTVSCSATSAGRQFKLAITAGSVQAQTLSVSGVPYPTPISISAGQSVHWEAD